MEWRTSACMLRTAGHLSPWVEQEDQHIPTITLIRERAPVLVATDTNLDGQGTGKARQGAMRFPSRVRSGPPMAFWGLATSPTG
jgi:hypothetical protein